MKWLNDMNSRTLGIIMTAIATAMLIAAISIGWIGVNRWLAISSLNTYFLASLENEPQQAMSAARAAAARLPKRAAAVMPSVNLASEEGLDLLDRLRRAAPIEERSLIASALAFGQAVCKKSVSDGFPETGDAVLVRWLDALNKGSMPKTTATSKEDPPHFQALAYVLQRHLQIGYATGNVAMMREAAGPLALLLPHHPDIGAIRFIAGACDASFSIEGMRQLGEHIASDDERIALARQFAQLVPEHRAQLLPLIPAEQRSDDESQAVLLTSHDALDKIVAKALNSASSDAILRNLSSRSLNTDRADLAKQLADKASPPLKNELLVNIAIYEGDLATLAKLSGTNPNLQPQITTPVMRFHMLAFHIATPSGLIPRTGKLKILLGGNEMGAGQITRYGSLIVLDTTDMPPGTVSLEVRLDQTPVYTGQVQL